ncbi:hypothetical protein [Novosphingobium taihuense]|nr:hypothetical protein [Novosphingobium taihuense]TWH83396.1 hypothetical protein IQ25_03058 [Novosphingobium taihuense]
MWLDRNIQTDAVLPSGGLDSALLQASYRRGVFRAKVNVRSLSCAIAQIDCMENPAIGTTVWLTFAGLESRAAVVEQSGGFRVMLRLIEPLHPAVLEALVGGRLRTWH